MRRSPLASAGLTLALALAPVTALASPCLEPAPDTTLQDRYSDCFATNRQAATAATRIEQVRLGRALFQSEPRDETWVTREGDDIVQASTYDCPHHAAELPEPEARALLTACIDLLQLHLGLVPPEFPGAFEYRQRSEAAQRQLAPLTPPTGPQPGAAATEPPPTTAPTEPSAPPSPKTAPSLRPLHTSLGLGLGLGLLGLAGLGGGSVYAVDMANEPIPGAPEDETCKERPDAEVCVKYFKGLGIAIVGGVVLAAATAITAVFATRLVRAKSRAHPNITASAAPARGGASIVLRIQF